MFSIVIPLYNKEKYIAQTLQSVLKQTFQEFEIIIVDDGSTDKSMQEVKKFDDNRICIFRQQNAGVSAARNRGIEESKYDMIAFLDADDEWLPNYLMTINLLINKYSECSVFATQYIVRSKTSSQSIDTKGLSFDIDGIMDNYFYIASINMPPLWTSAVVVKKKAMNAIGGFPIGIRAGEDLLTWARLASHYDIAYSTKAKAIFNRIDQELSTPPRLPDNHDKVSEELRKLLIQKNQDRLNGLKDYIAFWHKIRMAIFLRLDKSKEAKKEFQKMAEFSKKDLKFFVYLILVYSPQWISNFLNMSILQLNYYRRNFFSNRMANK